MRNLTTRIAFLAAGIMLLSQRARAGDLDVPGHPTFSDASGHTLVVEALGNYPDIADGVTNGDIGIGGIPDGGPAGTHDSDTLGINLDAFTSANGVGGALWHEYQHLLAARNAGKPQDPGGV